MTADISQAKETIARCRSLREAGRVEAVLRAEFQSRLRRIFSSVEDETWLNHYSEGAEAHTTLAGTRTTHVSRFIDNLIGSTTIEYEADLRITAKREEGFRQVKEHVTGLIRRGIPVSQVRGILSDTVEWYAYDVSLSENIDPARCAPTDITLILIEQLNLETQDNNSAQRLIQFIKKHLAREQSRPLKADFIALDLGLESSLYDRYQAALQKLVEDGRAADTSVALATDLWSRFVDHLEHNDKTFRVIAYVDEIYVCVLARLLSANALNGRALLSDDAELETILTGAFFRDRYGLANMVEQDYFGWLTAPAVLLKLLVSARQIQRDLYAYDFNHITDEDIFGRLMAQLARRSHRQLLGQEWTPRWLARELAKRCLGSLPEGTQPRVLDMCCGSGSILAETLKVARDQFGISDFNILKETVTGFDIDPLAVALAKTTWVITLATEIKSATGQVIIPVYHADSLFAVTPVSAKLPLLNEGKPVEIWLDGVAIKLPSEMIQPNFREFFDKIVDWAYDEALDAKSKGTAAHITPAVVDNFIANILDGQETIVPAAINKQISHGVHLLTHRMAELAVANRNGIWAFILRNTYRPSLLSGQFNGLVSNPPWLAMSALADNPYRSQLSDRAKLYGIKPDGASHLHLELAITHLLHAVDRYLCPGAAVACLIPGTVFNGDHYERFRQQAYLTSKRPVPLEVNEVWQIARGTFKYPGAAIIGHKKLAIGNVAHAAPSGCMAAETGITAAPLSIQNLGSRRSAWVFNSQGTTSGTIADTDLPLQGADLMPRSAVCIEISQKSGNEYRVETPRTGSAFAFATKDGKQLKGANFPGRVAPKFIFRMAQSVNLLPFTLGEHFALLAIPACRNGVGEWEVFDEADIRSQGHVETARRFAQINAKLSVVGRGQTLQERINERNKLAQQNFNSGDFLVLGGAGGKDVCAACLPVAGNEDLVIDQTIYWKCVPENEAWFRVGLLNTAAITKAISPYNPRGEFGERHIHTLPYRLLPAFDATSKAHDQVVRLAQQLAKSAKTMIAADMQLNNPSKAIHARRQRLRKQLLELNDYAALEEIAARILAN